MRFKGITLIELVVVMVILGVLAAVTLPRIIVNPSLSALVRAGLVRDDLRYAVDYALNTGIPVKVEFISSGNTGYSFWKKQGNTWVLLNRPGESSPYEVTLGTGDYAGLFFSDININGGNELYVNSMGVPYDRDMNPLVPGVSAYVILNDNKTVRFAPVSGLVVMEE